MSILDNLKSQDSELFMLEGAGILTPLGFHRLGKSTGYHGFYDEH